MGLSERKRNELENLKQQVLDIAEEIFVTEGAQHVTMRRIAASVGYAQTVLYRLFENKNDLMDHLIARGYEGVRARYDDVLKRENLNPLETLTGVLDEYVEYALEHPNHYQMWFETGNLRSEKKRLVLSHGRLEFVVFQTWIDCIESCSKAGLFKGQDSLEVFQILWARVHGLISLRIQYSTFPWMPVKAHLSEVLDLPRLSR